MRASRISGRSKVVNVEKLDVDQGCRLLATKVFLKFVILESPASEGNRERPADHGNHFCCRLVMRI